MSPCKESVLLDFVAQLPERQQQVVILYYGLFGLAQARKMSEVGEIIGVSESRVSQLHTKAVERLRVLAAQSRKLAA